MRRLSAVGLIGLLGCPTPEDTGHKDTSISDTDTDTDMDTDTDSDTDTDTDTDVVTVTGSTDLSGYTNTTLSGSGSVTNAVTAQITLDSALEGLISSSTASISGSNVNYSLLFNPVTWSSYTDGYVSGTATVQVCDTTPTCAQEDISVTGYAPSQVTVTVRTPDDKEPITTAYVFLDCDDDYIDGIVDSSGNLTAFLNDSVTCTVYADDDLTTLLHAKYNYNHEFTSGSEDEVSSGVYQVFAEIYDEFNPATLESEYATCYSGRLDSIRDLLMYGNGMLRTSDGRDSSRRYFKRFSENELTDTIKYFVETVDEDGNEISSSLYNSMYNAIVEGTERINDENPFEFTFLEEASTKNDANIIFLWGDQTNTGCAYNANDLVETYGTKYYCTIELHTASSRTVMEEWVNTLTPMGTDLCGDSITSGGTSFTTLDWLFVGNVHFAHYQNLMGRTE